MAKTVLYMSMSVDGFITGPNVRPDNGLGDGGIQLHEWVFGGPDFDHPRDVAPTGDVNAQFLEEMNETGAVVAGRKTFEPAGGWDGDHHNGVPIFIISRHAKPETMVQWPLVTYLSDPVEAIERAKAAAGDRDVMVHGSGIAQILIRLGLLDELQIHLVPILLGSGTKLFGEEGAIPAKLERTQVQVGEMGVTHMRFKVVK